LIADNHIQLLLLLLLLTPDHFGSLESIRGDKLRGLMQFSPQ